MSTLNSGPDLQSKAFNLYFRKCVDSCVKHKGFAGYTKINSQEQIVSFGNNSMTWDQALVIGGFLLNDSTKSASSNSATPSLSNPQPIN